MADTYSIQRRRGTTSENDGFTGANGEITVDTDRRELRVHDGSTQGGHIVPVNIQNVTNDEQVKVTGDTLEGNLSMDTYELQFGGTFKIVYNSVNDSLDIEAI